MRDGEVVGWGASRAAWAAPQVPSLSREVARALASLGVLDAYGVLGGGIAPFAAGLDTRQRFHSFRHEAGAGFAAIEAHHASGRPTLVVVTTGPGVANVENAMLAARVDGAKLLLVSGVTSTTQRGRGAVQETSPARLGSDWYRAGPLFHLAALPESVDEVSAFLAQLARGFAQPGGFVAHLALPLSLQTMIVAAPLVTPRISVATSTPTEATLDAVLARLRAPDALLWLGHGAQGAATDLRAFVERAGLPVLTSPRAKGLLPQRHPLHVGMTGAGGGKAALAYCSKHPPRHTLVLGTRLSEVTSFFAPVFAPRSSFVHVDIDASAFGAAYPCTETLGVVSTIEAFASALLARADAVGFFRGRAAVAEEVRAAVAAARQADVVVPVDATRAGDVDPRALMDALQDVVVDSSDALVMSEAGTAFTWCNARLAFDAPGRYRTSAAWGSMGHVTAGSVGAALAGDRPVVAVVGDGALLMNNEINTAVQYGARVVFVVLNDAQLGLNEHGMRALGMLPVETQLHRVDFVAFARSQGAAAAAVHEASALRPALRAALAHVNERRGPYVIDVRIDRSVPSPVVADRAASLVRQTHAGEGDA